MLADKKIKHHDMNCLEAFSTSQNPSFGSCFALMLPQMSVKKLLERSSLDHGEGGLKMQSPQSPSFANIAGKAIAALAIGDSFFEYCPQH
jgi:hypothetical protein